MLVGALVSIYRWGKIPPRGMRPGRVVFLFLDSDDAFPPELLWREKHQIHFVSLFAQRFRDKLSPFAYPECSWRVAFDDEDIELIGEVLCGDRVFHLPT